MRNFNKYFLFYINKIIIHGEGFHNRRPAQKVALNDVDKRVILEFSQEYLN